ncbi:unnamed protein product (macronuclear) [Paramecium tetraurelia]|uniref:Protein kinase domain-containing protein n=1 Tax=Paramecium tetraurelia TaxID=5888 RepID=A0E7X5_PARTE|nr:uncharacterized protein GSPATT00024120001 [Paramecium tetraurelia]CAK91392.1 unnamed protein product [Paramecium tetraurelia]|eukprot:XP_001458789.1 hypothetical protein (macronuclear) [Paramecium tetraurelia strain d4-2]
MNENDLYLINGLNFPQESKTQIYIISEPQGLKLLDSLSLAFKLFIYWSDESAIMDWNDFLEEPCFNEFYFKLSYQGKEYQIEGSRNQLEKLYDLCSGKFIFNKILETNSLYEMTLVTNKKNSKQYIKKRIFSNFNSQDLEMSNTYKTQLWQARVPEEIRIIQLLYSQRCPYIIKMVSIQYDGDDYSLIYANQNLISLKQILKRQKMGLPLSFVIEIVEQLLIVLNIFQELHIIQNSINLDMINYSLDSNSIVVSNFQSSTFECNRDMPIKGSSIGFIPPEYIQSKYLISPLANIFQLGVVLHHLLFYQNPFGNDLQTILKNNIEGKYHIPNHNFDMDIIEMLKSMMQANPHMRETPKEYLYSKIFKPQYRSKISKNSLLLCFQDISSKKVDEFEVKDEAITIQNIKFLCINNKKN